MKSHKETYPEQYSHPLVGKVVTCPDGTTGTVSRVVCSVRWGELAVLEPEGGDWWQVNCLVPAS